MKLRFPLLALCLVLLYEPFATAQSTRVEQIEVQVEAGHSLPPLVQERMRQSIQAIAGQMMLGQHVAGIEAQRLQKEQVIREVFDKILVGYGVESVHVTAGENTIVKVGLLPWEDVIREIRTEITVDGMSPEIEAMVRSDLAGVERVFDEALLGLPLAATDWTNGVLKRRLKEFMADHLPEYRVDFDVEPDAVTVVRVAVYPVLPVVRTIDLSMRSDTIPNLVLLDHRRILQDKADSLIGVPVSFVRRHGAILCEKLAEAVDEHPDFKHMGICTEVTLHPEEKLSVVSHSDTVDYRIRLEGMLDIGRKDTDEDMSFRLHAGRKLSRVDEVFLQMDFFPKNVRFQWQMGYTRALSSKGEISLRYDLNAKRYAVAASQRVMKDWLLRYEYRWSDHMGEVGIRYNLHDFLGVEFVADSGDPWLRLIGNF